MYSVEGHTKPLVNDVRKHVKGHALNVAETSVH